MPGQDLVCEKLAEDHNDLIELLVSGTTEPGRALLGLELADKCTVSQRDFELMEAKGFPLDGFKAAPQ